MNLLDNAPNQLSKFKSENWVEKNDESRGTYNKDNQMRFKTCISRINNTQVDGAHDIDIVMPMYNLIENSNDYSETFGIL